MSEAGVGRVVTVLLAEFGAAAINRYQAQGPFDRRRCGVGERRPCDCSRVRTRESWQGRILRPVLWPETRNGRESGSGRLSVFSRYQ